MVQDFGEHLYVVVYGPDSRNGQLLVTKLQPSALANINGSMVDNDGENSTGNSAREGIANDKGGSEEQQLKQEVVHVLQPHSMFVEIMQITLSDLYLAVLERRNGTLVATIYPLPNNGESCRLGGVSATAFLSS